MEELIETDNPVRFPDAFIKKWIFHKWGFQIRTLYFSERETVA
jgi:hypothetical protein